jgi:hypothetical protein
VLDAGVVGLDLACSCAGDDEDFDLVPPPADRAVELVGLWPSGWFNQDLEFLFRHGGVSQRVGAQQRPEQVKLSTKPSAVPTEAVPLPVPNHPRLVNHLAATNFLTPADWTSSCSHDRTNFQVRRNQALVEVL